MFSLCKQAVVLTAALVLLSVSSLLCDVRAASTSAPANPVRLIFVHHSVGEGWLSDTNGGLGIALRDNNYYVSDTNYDWGPDSIGSNTDIGNWWQWFRGPDSGKYLNALYAEGEQHSEYSRMSANPGSENQIIMFKSCFPNSALQGNVNDPVLPISSNPLRGEGSGSEFHTVANAKGIYIDLLEYFKTRPDKLFIAVTAPPLIDDTYANNARAFNNWLVNNWLSNYAVGNVFVFDFYNVLTTNGGNPDTNDLGLETGNHHRWWNGEIQHKTNGDDDANPNTAEYPTGDEHPSMAGNQKATAEFVPLLNYVVSTRTFVSPTSPTPPTSPTTSSEIPAQTETSVISSAPSVPSGTSGANVLESGNGSFPLEYVALIVVVGIVVIVALSVVLKRRSGNARILPPPPPPTPEVV